MKLMKVLGIVLAVGVIAAMASSLNPRPARGSGSGPVTVVNTPLPVQGAVNAAVTITNTVVHGNPGIDLQCEAQRIRNAPSPFHWSFRKTVPPFTNADWEADVTPNSIAGTLIDSSGTRAIHGARSDSTSWDTAVMILTAPLPTSTFALVNNSSAIVRAGEGNTNGEDAIKYTINTSRDTPADASLIRNVLGANGFIRGAAWVMRRGCPVKFVLDVEQHNSDGTMEKWHYEANVTPP